MGNHLGLGNKIGHIDMALGTWHIDTQNFTWNPKAQVLSILLEITQGSKARG